MDGLTQTYLQMPEASLVGLLDRDFEKLFQIEKKIREEWINRRKCACVNNPDVLNKRLLLTCEHVKKEIKEKTKEVEKKMNFKSDILILRNLISFQSSQHRSYAI